MFGRGFNEGIDTPRSSRDMVSTVTSVTRAQMDGGISCGCLFIVG